jgi:hypothetical protein
MNDDDLERLTRYVSRLWATGSYKEHDRLFHLATIGAVS